MELFSAIRALIASDRGGRKVSSLFRPEFLGEALALLENSSRVGVVTGFFVPAAMAPETDGPGGAVMVARALAQGGREVGLFTDPRCGAVLAACSGAVGGPEVAEVSGSGEILAFDPDLLVFVERLGRAADGRYYNMRMEDISDHTAPLDGAALWGRGLKVLAVGDGGNEAGMGVFRAELARMLPRYAPCLSVVGADAALPVDVSVWGGYALESLLRGEDGAWVGPRRGEIGRMLKAMVSAGAVDGVTLLPKPTVDGFGAEDHEAVTEALREMVISARLPS